MAVTRAETSEFGRASAGEASVVLMVYGSSGLLFVMPAIDRNAVAWLWPARLIPPDALRVFISVFGQSAMRPCAGPAGAESLTRSGLAHTIVVTLLWKNDPS